MNDVILNHDNNLIQPIQVCCDGLYIALTANSMFHWCEISEARQDVEFQSPLLLPVVLSGVSWLVLQLWPALLNLHLLQLPPHGRLPGTLRCRQVCQDPGEGAGGHNVSRLVFLASPDSRTSGRENVSNLHVSQHRIQSSLGLWQGQNEVISHSERVKLSFYTRLSGGTGGMPYVGSMTFWSLLFIIIGLKDCRGRDALGEEVGVPRPPWEVHPLSGGGGHSRVEVSGGPRLYWGLHWQPACHHQNVPRISAWSPATQNHARNCSEVPQGRSGLRKHGGDVLCWRSAELELLQEQFHQSHPLLPVSSLVSSRGKVCHGQ